MPHPSTLTRQGGRDPTVAGCGPRSSSPASARPMRSRWKRSNSTGTTPFRRRLVRSVGTLRGAVAAGVVTLGCIALAAFGQDPVVGAAFGVVVLVMSWRFWLAGIRVGPKGVRIVGLLGASHAVPWGSIDHFAVGPFRGYRYVAHVVLRDGREFACLGISAANGPNPARRRLEVERPVDGLNTTLAAWRASTGQVREP
jgi:hypothetical protein